MAATPTPYGALKRMAQAVRGLLVTVVAATPTPYGALKLGVFSANAFEVVHCGGNANALRGTETPHNVIVSNFFPISGGNANALRGTETELSLVTVSLYLRGGNANALRGTETCNKEVALIFWHVAATPTPYGALKHHGPFWRCHCRNEWRQRQRPTGH